MRTFGRILCLVVAVALVALGVPNFIDALNGLNASGWNDIAAYPEKLAYLSAFITAIGYFLLALSALLTASTGHAGFFKILVALIALGVVTWNIYNQVKTGAVQGFLPIMNSIFSFALPIGYAVGVIFVGFAPRK